MIRQKQLRRFNKTWCCLAAVWAVAGCAAPTTDQTTTTPTETSQHKATAEQAPSTGKNVIRLSDLAPKPKEPPPPIERPADVETQLAAGHAAWDRGDLNQAAMEFQEIVDSYGESPFTFDARFQLGSLAFAADDDQGTEFWLSGLTQLDPDKYLPPLSEMLLTSLHRLDDRDAIDAEIDRLNRAWRALPPSVRQRETAFVRERFDLGEHNVVATETFEATPPYRRKYLFSIVDRGTEEITSAEQVTAFSLGSFVSTESIARSNGDIRADGRLYHLDFYQCRTHRTLGFFAEEPPGYWETKSMVLEVLNDQTDELSSREAGTGCDFAPFLVL